MDELTIGDKTYVSSKRAAKITGYATDYVGQLCREGRVEARLVGRNWYVLEGAIREHRFGAPTEKIGSAQVTADKKETESKWEAPQYVAEPTAFVPELAPKPVVEAAAEDQGKKAVSEMQSAWQEWFATERKALPDGHEMLDEANLPAVIEEQVEEMPEEALETPLEAPETLEDEVMAPEPVLLSRIAQDVVEEPIEVEETVPLHRSYASMDSGEEIPAQSSVVDLSSHPETKKKEKRVTRAVRTGNSQQGGGTTVVLKAVFISLAGLAVVVAVIGSGFAENAAGASTTSLQAKVIHFFDGTKIVNK